MIGKAHHKPASGKNLLASLIRIFKINCIINSYLCISEAGYRPFLLSRRAKISSPASPARKLNPDKAVSSVYTGAGPIRACYNAGCASHRSHASQADRAMAGNPATLVGECCLSVRGCSALRARADAFVALCSGNANGVAGVPRVVACANPALRSSTATRHACEPGWVLRTGAGV